MVNNAGGAPWADSATASPRFNEKIIALNLIAPFTVAQAANRVMQAQDDGGAIVNIASVSGTRPSPGTAAYGAAKAGLLNLTQTLAVEWAPKVRVNAVDRRAHRHRAGPPVLRRRGHPGRAWRPRSRWAAWARPDDVAAACLFLSSPAASYVTGAALPVHGGNERPAYLSARLPAADAAIATVPGMRTAPFSAAPGRSDGCHTVPDCLTG